jgi:hypothetical protein
MELDSQDKLVVHTKVQLKFMMKGKGKEHVKEGNSLAKVIRKQAPTKTKENQKMLQWIQMGSKRSTMGKPSQFGWLVCYSLDSSTTRPIGGVFTHMGAH